jgi:hypothetical protein
MKYSPMCSCSWNVKNALLDAVVLTAPFNSRYRFPLSLSDGYNFGEPAMVQFCIYEGTHMYIATRSVAGAFRPVMYCTAIQRRQW